MMKILAMLAMFTAHLNTIVFNDLYYWMELVGLLAMPVFSFYIARNYFLTSDIWKYSKRLLIFALISQPFYMLSYPMLNVIFTLLVGLLVIHSMVTKNYIYIPLLFLVSLVCVGGPIWVLVVAIMGLAFSNFGVPVFTEAKKGKLFFYFFYPGHLFLLFIVGVYANG